MHFLIFITCSIQAFEYHDYPVDYVRELSDQLIYAQSLLFFDCPFRPFRRPPERYPNSRLAFEQVSMFQEVILCARQNLAGVVFCIVPTARASLGRSFFFFLIELYGT